MMTHDQSTKMAEAFKSLGGFTSVKVAHAGFFAVLTDEVKNDGQWSVELWSVNAKAGNRSLTTVKDYSDDAKHIACIARAAQGKATKRDRDAMARAEAGSEVDSE